MKDTLFVPTFDPATAINVLNSFYVVFGLSSIHIVGIDGCSSKNFIFYFPEQSIASE